MLIRTDTTNCATLTEKELSQHCAVVPCDHRNSTGGGGGVWCVVCVVYVVCGVCGGGEVTLALRALVPVHLGRDKEERLQQVWKAAGWLEEHLPCPFSFDDPNLFVCCKKRSRGPVKVREVSKAMLIKSLKRPFLLAVMVRRRTFSQEDPLIVFFTM